ncbi:MAG: methyltransferase domain-containing protein [Winogradskyella sp.]|nr:methyltransferase domain-containing protein [Winogradskyella sp.]MBT8245037.1 class I SAM-dependent methyltransferase [Winogradskyella sp.]NNK22121.1 methyltransferase domain-containing protein [Winogradskyella sp.]
MQQIYEQHFWGGNDYDFYSGEGSHKAKIIEAYIEAVSEFLKSKNNTLTVLDLGCGDFNIGKHFVPYSKKYIAVDIVDNLIKRNITKFQVENLEFRCLDISKDKLPKADCVILRQVLQHLSNSEIKAILKMLSNYKYIILTEHLPLGDFTPNKDKVTNLGIRLKQNSGVTVLASPFNFKISSKRVLNEIVLENSKGRIETLLLTL